MRISVSVDVRVTEPPNADGVYTLDYSRSEQDRLRNAMVEWLAKLLVEQGAIHGKDLTVTDPGGNAKTYLVECPCIRSLK